MKKLVFIILAIMSLQLGSFAQTKPAKPAKPATAKTKAAADTTKAKKDIVLKKDGTPDKRYKNNAHVKKDGTPDKRYKENKKDKPAQ